MSNLHNLVLNPPHNVVNNTLNIANNNPLFVQFLRDCVTQELQTMIYAPHPIAECARGRVQSLLGVIRLIETAPELAQQVQFSQQPPQQYAF